MKDSRVYTVSSGKKNHLTLAKLRSNRKYYAQVRTYVKENDIRKPTAAGVKKPASVLNHFI